MFTLNENDQRTIQIVVSRDDLEEAIRTVVGEILTEKEEASRDARITKATLKDIDFPRNAIIGGVIRGSDSFIAVGDTRIEPYDRVAVFALPDAVKEVDKFFK